MNWISSDEPEPVCGECGKPKEHWQHDPVNDWIGGKGNSHKFKPVESRSNKILCAQLYRSLTRLHLAVKACAAIGFEESSPINSEHHASIWNDLNEAQADAALKLKHFSAASMEGEADLEIPLRQLANEASGFLSMASHEAHGFTNMRVLELRINEARAALRKTEHTPRQPEETQG